MCREGDSCGAESGHSVDAPERGGQSKIPTKNLTGFLAGITIAASFQGEQPGFPADPGHGRLKDRL